MDMIYLTLNLIFTTIIYLFSVNLYSHLQLRRNVPFRFSILVIRMHCTSLSSSLAYCPFVQFMIIHFKHLYQFYLQSRYAFDWTLENSLLTNPNDDMYH